MKDIDSIIQTSENICDNLSHLANDEKRFGSEISHMLDQINYDMFKTVSHLKSLNFYLTGGGYD